MTRMNLLALVSGALVLTSASCDRNEPPPGDAPKTAAAPERAPKAPPSQPIPAANITSEAQVKSVIEAWALAQNKGNFDSYREFYAARFTGVKRAGDRVKRMGLDAWLEDRKAMFEKPFTVGVSNLKVSFAPSVAIVTFEQSWKSATFRDKGTKQILFVKEGERLRISREEMLDSETSEKNETVDLPFEQIALAARTIDSVSLLVPGPVDINWATEHPRYLSNERAQRSVSTEAVPASLRKLLEPKYEVFTPSGKRCEAKARGFVYQIHVIPHFGTTNFWEDYFAEFEKRPKNPVPAEARAVDLWGMATGPYFESADHPGITLAVELEPMKDCQDAAWGRMVKAGAPPPWTLRAPTEDEASKLSVAVDRHPLVVKFDAQAKAEGSTLPGGRWLAGTVEDTPAFISNEAGVEYLYTLVHGMGGCASSNPPTLGLLFRIQGGRLVPEDHIYAEGPIFGVVDADGDGDAEFVTGTTILSGATGGLRHVIDRSPLFLDCGC